MREANDTLPDLPDNHRTPLRNSSGAGTSPPLAVVPAAFTHPNVGMAPPPGTEQEPQLSASKKRTSRSDEEKLTSVLDHLQTIHWTVADFLFEFFRLEDKDAGRVHRNARHGTMVGMFLSGRMKHTAADIVSAWLRDEAGRPKRLSDAYSHMYSLDLKWEEHRHARVALTSMAAQLCRQQLRREQQSAVRGKHGLHGTAAALYGHLQLSWEDIGQKTVSNVEGILKKHQPLTLGLITALATPVPQKNDAGVRVVRKSRPPALVATEVLSTLNFSRTKFARLLPAARSILCFACGVPRILFDYSSRVGNTLSWSATYELLARLAAQDKVELVELAKSANRWPILRIDNVQQYQKRRELRMGRENAMKVGVAGTVAEALDFEPSAADLDDRRQRIAENARKDLTVDKLLGLVDWDFKETCLVLQWIQTLVTYVPALAHYRARIADLYRTDATKMPAAATCTKTPIHPLGTVAKNETITTELRDTLVDFFNQMGQTDEAFNRRIVPVGGDGLTFEKLVQMKNLLQFQDNEFRRFEVVMPFLETWHTQWTYLSMVFEVHFGKHLTDDPSALGHSAAKIDQKAPANLKKVDYYPSMYLAYIVLDARILDCWRTYYDTDDIFGYFNGLKADDALPSIEELRKVARELHGRYSCQRAWYDAMDGGDAAAEAGWKAGSPWEQKKSEHTPANTTGSASQNTTSTTRTTGSAGKRAAASESGAEDATPPFSGDRTLAQSILFMINAMLSRDAAQAVAMGDVGRLWNDLKVMTFHFEGSSHTKYGGYLLEQTCSLELEASDALRRNFLRNWLVNPSGEPGRTIEGDLFEEHINLELEEAITRKDAEWDNTFLREVISPNVHHFVVLKGEWGLGVGLAKCRGHHPEPHSRPEITKLLALYKKEELHLFREGRSYKDSQHHVNTYAEGIKNLQKKKLRRFILDSTRPRVNIGPIPQSQTTGNELQAPVIQTSGQAPRSHQPADGDSDDEASGEESALEEGSGDDDDEEVRLTRGRVDLVEGQVSVDFDARALSGDTDSDDQHDGDSSMDELEGEREDESEGLDSGGEDSD
ncbi:hypothetical protein VTO73DRAFT_1782 [Trametes versicolor]